MGANAFASLHFPCQLSLSVDEIESRWQALSRELHPDAESGDTNHAAEINQAYETLRHAGSRLRHWLELNDVEIPRNASIDEKMMAQFSEVGALLAKADGFIAKKKAATSTIAKALLADEEFGVQREIQDRMSNLKAQIEGVTDDFAMFETDHAAGVRGLERLRFLEKWFQQCQDRLVVILSA